MASKLQTVKLSDKYDLNEGRIFITGAQAIARLPIIQKSQDSRAGLNTAGFISGYRGSPMGMIDAILWKEKKRLDAADITFQPGINEDLAATAVWGTQQFENFQNPLVDGVFSFWYGKAPGVDRSGDVMRHANMAGTHKNGGVLVFYGDDHPGKSSTVVCQSEPLLSAMHIPSLYPANVQEIIEFGMLGWALSRYCGLWIGLKCVNETVEQTRTVDIDLENFKAILPDRGASEGLVNIKAGFASRIQWDIILKRHRLPLVHKFVRANDIDKVKINGRGGIGIVTSGKTYEDVIHGLNLIGLTAEKAREIGLGVYKVGCIWPLEPTGLREFAEGRPEVIFIEEKDAFMEDQAARIFINAQTHPLMVGKTDDKGNMLFPSDELLEPSNIGQVIAARLGKYGMLDDVVRGQCDSLAGNIASNRVLKNSPLPIRMPFFCSGCPHNRSTKLPDGSLAMAGIGCHSMAIFNGLTTLPPTQMGGEGMNWAGASSFSGTRHMFQNLGDGTYFHSGLLALRGAVASGVNITYKILYNDAVAMTGGQPIDGPISVAEMIRQVTAEGIAKCVLVTDSPKNYKTTEGFPRDIEIYHRDELDLVQRQMRGIEGTSVLIYEQTCAAEKRRRRKRGKFPDPAKRIFINEAVCEGCGDCSVQSTCVSIQPLATSFGTKRKIDQSGCNKDYSCLRGFCPSFVTVLGAGPRKKAALDLAEDLFDDLPDAGTAVPHDPVMSIMIAGIGGTGVITVGAILGMAAHLEGKACSIYDMTGLSQKNGAVYSHVKIADDLAMLSTQRIGAGEADLVLGFDLLAALSDDAAATYDNERTRIVGNRDVSVTSHFQFDRNLTVDQDQVAGRIREKAQPGQSHLIDATNIALRLCGDTIASNMFILGFAAQKSFLPVSVKAITRAIELNAIAVPFNLSAFALGRLYAHAPHVIEARLPENETGGEETLAQVIDRRAAYLTAYQDKAYARRYLTLVKKVRQAEEMLGAAAGLARAVAINLSKLMAYKDEYEVARLYSDPKFIQDIEEQFEAGYRLKFNLAPPFLAKKDKVTGHLLKSEYGMWVMPVFKTLAGLKGLRGGMFDLFGKSAERKMERRLISDYEIMMLSALDNLTSENLKYVLELANLPDQIRGFGHVKQKAVAEMEARKVKILKSLAHMK